MVFLQTRVIQTEGGVDGLAQITYVGRGLMQRVGGWKGRGLTQTRGDTFAINSARRLNELLITI